MGSYPHSLRGLFFSIHGIINKVSTKNYRIICKREVLDYINDKTSEQFLHRQCHSCIEEKIFITFFS